MTVQTATLTTASVPAPAATVRDRRRFHRRVGGISLVAAPVALLASEAAYRGTNSSAQLVSDAAVHSSAIIASNVLLLVSAALFVPAAFTIAHLARDRGRRLAFFGVALAVLGSLGHAAYVGFSTVVLSTPAGDRTQMVSLLNRVNHSAAVAPIGLCIFAFAISVVLLAVAAWRAGVVHVYAPIAIAAAFALEVANVSSVAGGIAKEALAVIAFAGVGLRVLSMSDQAWSTSA